jgi:hypothetical protein
MSRTLASSVGLTNDWLQSQGLVSLLSLWIKRAPLRRIASFGPACYVVWGAGGESRLPTRFGMPYPQIASTTIWITFSS